MQARTPDRALSRLWMWLAAVMLLCAAHARGASDWSVSAPEEMPPLQFAAQQIRSALAGTPGSGRIVIDRPSGAGKPESFRVIVTGTTVRVIGSDARGAMYGGLDVAEQIRLRGPSAVKPSSHQPFLAVRAFKFNVPLPSSRNYVSSEDLAHIDWFYDPAYWDALLADLARERYNVLTLWHAHPYYQIVRIHKYPEANEIPEQDLKRNMALFHHILRRARDFGIDTYLITWNIHMPEAFKNAHGVTDGQDSPVVRDYQKECVREMLKEYPELTGIGTCPGEFMPGSADDREQWIKETYFKGIAESGRTMPFIHRYWGAEPAAAAKMLRDYKYPAPVWLDIKYNGEHLYCSTKPHFLDQRWFDQKPLPYKLLWHLRADLIQLRWGDPDFVKAVVRGCGGQDSAGFVIGSELDVPGVDRFHTSQTADHVTWKYVFERQWLRMSMWGRLGYDPNEPDKLWSDTLGSRFGKKSGPEAFAAIQNASKILPLVTSFHWSYMDADWYPEGDIGAANTSVYLPIPNYRERTAYNNIRDWMFNSTIDASLQSIAEYVADKLNGRPTPGAGQSPVETARRLEALANAAESHLQAAVRNGASGKEWQCTRMDIETVVQLGHYYSSKIRSAVSMLEFLITSSEADRQDALKSIQDARKHWGEVVRTADSHYIPHEILSFGDFNWGKYTPDVDSDIAWMRTARPFAREEIEWTLNSGGIIRVPQFSAPDWKPQLEDWRDPWLSLLSARVGLSNSPEATSSGASLSTLVRSGSAGLGVLRVCCPDMRSMSIDGEERPIDNRQIIHCTAVEAKDAENTLALSLSSPIRYMPLVKWDLPPIPGAKFFDAESCRLTSPMTAVPFAGCCGRMAVRIPRGPQYRAGGGLRQSVEVPSEGDYVILARVWWEWRNRKPFMASWDGRAAEPIEGADAFGHWTWFRTKPTHLSRGKHDLSITNQDDDMAIDCFVVAPESGG